MLVFLFEREEEFSFNPSLLSSRGGETDILRRHIRLTGGTWDHEDSFYVATDALAAWFLQTVHQGGRPWEPLRDMNTVDFDLDFDSWVNSKREAAEMSDDDTTLVRVDLY